MLIKKPTKIVNNFNLAILSINLFWLMALYPARLGADSSALLQMIRDGKSTDWWTGAFYWFLRITSINGHYPQLTSAIQLTVLTCSVIFFLNSLPILQKTKNVIALIFFATPIHGFFAMSLSHDLTQTAGIILLVSIELRNLQNKKILNFPLILLIASLLLLTTHTGIVLVFLALARNYRKLNWKWLFTLALISALIATFSSTGLSKGLNVHGNYLKTSNIKFNWMLAGLKCVAQHPEADLSIEDWGVLKKIANEENWKVAVSCHNYDEQLGTLDLSRSGYQLGSQEFFETYISIAAKNPAVVAMSHIQRARGALPPLLFQPPDNQVPLDVSIPVGQGTNTALQTGPELLHPSNDLSGEENNKPTIFSILEIPAQGAAFIFNQASWFWGWGGLWLSVYFILLIVLLKGVKVWKIVLSTSPLITIHLLLLIAIPTSLPRYYMFSTILGLLLSLITISNAVLKRK